METTLIETLQSIEQTSTARFEKANQQLDSLVKPPRSLGHLEQIAARLSAISDEPGFRVEKRCVVVLAADNGVVAEGVSSAPQVVTALQTMNILNGVAGVSVLASQFKTDLFVFDMGINADMTHPRLIDRKIRKSTGNIVREPAMTREEALQAIETGIAIANDLKAQGYQGIGVGEMGIGNTTTSSAILSVLLGLDENQVEQTVGRGAGLTDHDFYHKVDVIRQAIQFNQPDRNDVVDILSKVGGLDLATMTGVYIGAAACKIPVVIDGFISVVAALCASRLNPLVNGYLFASHQSFERGYLLALQELHLEAPLKLDMRLGEGSGCPLLFALMDAASCVIHEMGTLNDTGIELDYSEDVNF
jgi:nicotinate-nucleotide--dimethylbenzimidazole phosphoribosyltransferase